MKSLLLVVAAVVLSACKTCNDAEEDYMSISVVKDVTDVHAVYPDAKPILRLYNFPANRANAVHFRYREISNIVLMPVIDMTLAEASATEKNNSWNEPLFREKAIVHFFDSIQSILASKRSDTTRATHSQCFKSISSELTTLVNKKSRRKILLIYSNLLENSSIWNAYSVEGKKMLSRSPESIEIIFDQAKLLPISLGGIDVVFIYKPRTMEDDKKFNAMVEVYRNLLQTRGARCQVQANNSYVDL